VSAGRVASIDLRGPGSGSGSGSADVVDLGRAWLAPGFIDTHVHGGGGAQFNTSDVDEVLAAAAFHGSHGTTGMLATTVTASVPELCACLGAISACVGRSGILGAHLEGPVLSARFPGAMDPALFLMPDAADVARLLEAGDGSVRMMTVAPELPGGIDLVRTLVGSGVVASLGHTDADLSIALAAIGAGASAATHVFNAMRPLHHRDPGVTGAVLDSPQVSCELICDGVHVDPVTLRLAFRAKGAAGVRLVTDAMAAAGMPDGSYALGSTGVVVSGGRATVAESDAIAGSTLTMDAAVWNAVRYLGVGVPDAVLMASGNPARLLRIDDRKGTIAAGMDADLVVLDDDLAVRRTMIGGEWVFQR
jgi:N-acetylglucosamine-6-phosphate deacetylase